MKEMMIKDNLVYWAVRVLVLGADAFWYVFGGGLSGHFRDIAPHLISSVSFFIVAFWLFLFSLLANGSPAFIFALTFVALGLLARISEDIKELLALVRRRW